MKKLLMFKLLCLCLLLSFTACKEEFISIDRATVEFFNTTTEEIILTIYTIDSELKIVIEGLDSYLKKMTTIEGYTYFFISAEGRFLSSYVSDVYEVEADSKTDISFVADIGWMNLTNNTTLTLRFVKYGEEAFIYDKNGEPLVYDSYFYPGETRYLLYDETRMGIPENTVTFWVDSTTYSVDEPVPIIEVGKEKSILITPETKVTPLN